MTRKSFLSSLLSIPAALLARKPTPEHYATGLFEAMPGIGLKYPLAGMGEAVQLPNADGQTPEPWRRASVCTPCGFERETNPDYWVQELRASRIKSCAGCGESPCIGRPDAYRHYVTGEGGHRRWWQDRHFGGRKVTDELSRSQAIQSLPFKNVDAWDRLIDGKYYELRHGKLTKYGQSTP